MENKILINRKLPSLNDVIQKNRQNRYEGARYKSEIESDIAWAIKKAMQEGNLHPVEKPCIAIIDWYEGDRRRDVDNIQSSAKFILDALVEQKILKNDNRRHVKQVFHTVHDAEKHYVEVRLVEDFGV